MSPYFFQAMSDEVDSLTLLEPGCILLCSSPGGAGGAAHSGEQVHGATPLR